MSSEKPIILFLCLFYLFSAGAQSLDINFTSLRTKDGLSSNSVNAIIKDKQGLIWFGTEDGLDKFDGTNFTIYRHKQGDATTLQANEILSLHEDRSGNLWVGTSGGSLSLYDRKKDVFINFPSDGKQNAITNNVINGIGSDYHGRIWIATYSGVNILDPKTKQVTNFPLGRSNNSVTEKVAICITEDSRHQMWIGTTEGLFRYNPKDKALVHYVHAANDPSSLADNYIHSIAEDSKGNLWIATSGGLNMLKAGSEKFTTYNHNNNLSSDIIYSISIDDDKLWLGTEEGLNILNSKTGEITTFKQDYRNIHGLSAKAIHCIYIDKQGIYWLGTSRGGVDKYDRNLNLFNYVEGNSFDQKGLNASIVTSFAENTDGNVYVGTEGLLTLFDRKTKLF
ncbi:MAG: two-component regulator propeller domain-containing protein, partial [Candidatus Dadabacteria bacterium]